MEQKILKEQLETVNQSTFYLILIILAVLLSFWSVLIQREQLKEALAGNVQKATVQDVFPLKFNASVLTVSALGFFFALALRNCRDTDQRNDPIAQKSAGMNVWASLFVLTAALIRFYDLNFMEQFQRSLMAESVQPE